MPSSFPPPCLQSLLSPVFMSRKQRAMYCEMDEPGRCAPAAAAQRGEAAGVSSGLPLSGLRAAVVAAAAAVSEHMRGAAALLLLQEDCFPKGPPPQRAPAALCGLCVWLLCAAARQPLARAVDAGGRLDCQLPVPGELACSATNEELVCSRQLVSHHPATATKVFPAVPPGPLVCRAPARCLAPAWRST